MTQKKLPNISIVIVNYNSRPFIKECLDSLLRLEYSREKLEIIIVDNCSQDGSPDFIKEDYPGVILVKNNANNYARAINLGIKNTKSKYVVLLNSDTRVERNWLKELVRALLSDVSIAAAGSKIISFGGKIESLGHEQLENFYWADKKQKCPEEKGADFEEAESLSGCAMLLRKQAWEQIGGFDEDFLMYMEDVDFCFRLKQKGWKLVFAPASVLCHQHHGSGSAEIATYYTERNRLFFIAKHYPQQLATALLGRGYFSEDIYRILPELIIKITKHHKGEFLKKILDELAVELKNLRDRQKLPLSQRILELKELTDTQQKNIQEKDAYLGTLKNESARKDSLLAEKESCIKDIQESLHKRNEDINLLNQEIEGEKKNILNLNQIIQQIDEQLEKAARSLADKERRLVTLQNRNSELEGQLSKIYNSTAFRFLVSPLWKLLWPVKRALLKKHQLEKEISACPGAAGPKPLADPISTIGICTIISKNYLSYARVLADSYLEHNPGRVFVLLTDHLDNYFEPQHEKFTLIEIETLKDRIPEYKKFCFQYNPTEINTAVKPFFLEFLREEFKLQKLIFLDPDILITRPLEEIYGLLNKYSIVLIPHITRPYPDNRKPCEIDILKTGVYNLGFIALVFNETTKKLLRWWKERLARFCIIDLDNGLFVDQKWIDLIPGFFDDVFILRKNGYNIAYWNLHYRKMYFNNGQIFLEGEPVYFVHFSGFEPQKPHHISKYQDRFSFNDFKQLRPIFQFYKNKLIANGYNVSKDWPCVFDYFDDGAKIPEFARRIYWELDCDTRNKLGNPFSTSSEGSFFNWLKKGVDNNYPKITRFMYGLYRYRHDVQVAYPDIFGNDRVGFVQWFLTSAQKEHNLDRVFLEAVGDLNSKWHARSFVVLKTKVLYWMREVLKRSLKMIFRDNLAMINKLKSLEFRIQRQAVALKGIFKKSRHLVLIGIHRKKRGVNVVGYLNAEMGVGESARANIKCIENVGMSFSLINIDSHCFSRKYDFSFRKFSSTNAFGINLIHVNADLFGRLYAEKGRDFFKDKYNIGFWAWELPEFPDEWLGSFKYCDEIWTPSSFALASIAKKSPVPVIRMPLAVNLENIKPLSRAQFNLKPEEFIFLFIFDFFSFFERKNPLAIIEAFKKSFSPTENVRLVIKCINSSFSPREMEKMKTAAAGLNVTIIDEYFYRDEINALLSLCDCYVSLHRCEGFGLTLAEAMFLEKPVIATAYSGNMDFMDITNSYPVKYKLKEIEKDFGPYKKGQIWAEPDIPHAAELMRRVYADRKSSREIGRSGTLNIKRLLSYEAVGREIKQRLSLIAP